jgi:Domain of unknown function (DUF3859)
LTRRFAAMLWLLTLCASSAAQSPSTAVKSAPVEIVRIEVSDYGVYSLDAQQDSQTSIQGLHQRQVGNVHLFEQKRIIYLRKGVHFGFHYSIVGSPQDASVPLRMVTIFPPGGLRNPAWPHTIPNSEFSVTAKIGEDYSLYHGIALDYDWALVPGIWTLQIWSGERLLASEDFTLLP